MWLIVEKKKITMDTASILLKKSPVKHCISIKAFVAPETIGLREKTTIKSDFKYNEEKAIVIDMFDNRMEQERKKIKFTYTLKNGDDKRLNSEGVLQVYNISKPINIPVVKLLGKWEKTHVGITLIQINENWCIKGRMVKKITPDQKPAYAAFKRLLKFVMA